MHRELCLARIAADLKGVVLAHTQINTHNDWGLQCEGCAGASSFRCDDSCPPPPQVPEWLSLSLVPQASVLPPSAQLIALSQELAS